jgi:hypothetical protein
MLNRTAVITDISTWDYASSSLKLRWNGNIIIGSNGESLSEKDAVDLFRAIFNFLERNGDIVPLDKKISSVKNILNRSERLQSDPEYYLQLLAEQDKDVPEGIFDPRNPETYKFAKNNKPLVIDGIHIFNTRKVSGREAKEDETEKGFVQLITMSMELNRKSVKWQKAVDSVKADLIKQGVENPSDTTPGYTDKINELYQSMLKDNSANPEQDRVYIEKYIRRRIAECTPRKLTIYGGYGFCEAQMEVLDGCPKEKIEKIGKIMAMGKDKGGSKLKQEIFNSLGTSGEFIVALRNADTDPEYEERIMFDFYSSITFDTKEEAVKFFNENHYLAKRPELKNEALGYALELTSAMMSSLFYTVPFGRLQRPE